MEEVGDEHWKTPENKANSKKANTKALRAFPSQFSAQSTEKLQLDSLDIITVMSSIYISNMSTTIKGINISLKV